jgi:ABC-type glycerol-3-phosphate transport system permease component
VKVVRHIVLAACVIFFLTPILFSLSAALHSNSDLFSIPFQWIVHFHPSNFGEALSAAPFFRFFFNSFVVSISVTAGAVLLGNAAGYSLSKFAFRGRNLIFMAIVATLLIPFSAVLIPVFLLVKDFGWINSYFGLIVPGIVTAQSVFFMRQYLQSLPDEMLWAARIDGASEISIYLRLVLPLSAPVMAAIAVLTFVGSWNDLLWPLVVVQTTNMDTVPLGLQLFTSAYFTNYVEVSAMALLALLPAAAVFLVLGRWLVRSLMVSGGGVKA